MTHDELLAKIDKLKTNASGDVWLIHNDRCCGNCTCDKEEQEVISPHKALRAVVELHKPTDEKYEIRFAGDELNYGCTGCPQNEEYGVPYYVYPCPTIQAIEKELK